MTLFNFINLVIAYGIILLETQKADKHCNAHRRLEEKHLSFLQKRKISIKLKNKDMKKKSHVDLPYGENPPINQIFRIMKVTVFLLCFCSLSMVASTVNSQNARVSIKKSNAPLEEILNEIENQTDYLFMYSDVVNVKQRVSVKAKEQPVSKVLRELFDGKVGYKMEGSHIILSPATEDEQTASSEQTSNITVKGQVLDETGQTVPGVNIIVKGNSSLGTVTDLDGNFTLNVPKGVTMVVSFIGYKNYEFVAVADKAVVINLVPDTEVLDEVVVVGYTTVKKSSITGAIGSVKADKLKDVTTPDVSGMLQGKVAGVVVTPTSGKPGSEVSIRVRGIGSIRGNQSPLWVIDGVVGASGAELNPNDIEAISVLKDGSATALYGSRGANGVIQVTTKRAKSGTSQFEAGAKFGLSELQRGNLRMMNGAEYYDYLYEAFTNAGTLEEQHWFQPYLRNQNFDWWEEATQVATTQNYNVSYKYGNDKIRSYISADYYTEDGAIKGYDYDRVTLRTNTDYVVNNRLTLKASLALSYKETFDQQQSLSYASYTPWDSPYNSKGELKTGQEGLPSKEDAATADPRDYWYSDGGYNYMNYYQRHWSKNRNNSMNINLGFHYKLLDFLKYESNNQVSFINSYNEQYTDPKDHGQEADHGKVYNGNSNSRHLYLSQMLHLTRIFADIHEVDAYLGYDYDESRYFSNWGQAKNIYSGAEVIGAGAGDQTAGGSKSERKNAAVYFNANYTYDSKYLLQVMVRRDGSSRFGTNKRWGTFWSVGGGWNLHKEAFMEELTFIDEFKPRFSYGISGNEPGGAYEWTTKLDITQQYANEIAFFSNYAGNPNLSWEETASLDYGVDMRLFDRVSITVDGYYRKAKNLIYLRHLPAVSGYNRQTANDGSMVNKGFELTVTPELIKTKDIYWDMTFNMGYNKNEITKMPSGDELYTQATAEGYPYMNWYMREWAGVDPMTGRPLWFVVDKETGDRTVTGDYNKATRQLLDAVPIPKVNGAIGTNFSWKGLSVNANFTFSTGAKIYNSARAAALDRDAGRTSQPPMKLADGWNRWQKPGDRATHPQLIAGGNNSADGESTRYLENGDYFKLKSLSVSYSLPEQWIKPLSLKSARISLGGENLFTVTKFSGIDPEVLFSSSYNGKASSGNSYPSVRRFTMGLNVTF